MEEAMDNEYVEELEDLVLLMYEGFVLGYIDLMEDEEQMRIIDDIVKRVNATGIEEKHAEGK